MASYNAISQGSTTVKKVEEILKRPLDEQNVFSEQKRINGMYEYNLQFMTRPADPEDYANKYANKNMRETA
jgi:hypothetical protein